MREWPVGHPMGQKAFREKEKKALEAKTKAKSKPEKSR
jgi:hypothetical protein